MQPFKNKSVYIASDREGLTRISSRRKGERMRAVKALETTVGGFFSGSLNRCCTWKGTGVRRSNVRQGLEAS